MNRDRERPRRLRERCRFGLPRISLGNNAERVAVYIVLREVHIAHAVFIGEDVREVLFFPLAYLGEFLRFARRIKR